MSHLATRGVLPIFCLFSLSTYSPSPSTLLEWPGFCLCCPIAWSLVLRFPFLIPLSKTSCQMPETWHWSHASQCPLLLSFLYFLYLMEFHVTVYFFTLLLSVRGVWIVPVLTSCENGLNRCKTTFFSPKTDLCSLGSSYQLIRGSTPGVEGFLFFFCFVFLALLLC